MSGFNGQYGPLSQGIATDGNVITGSFINRRISVFRDADGQTLPDAVTSVAYTCETSNCNFSMTTAGGQVYGAQAQGGIFTTSPPTAHLPRYRICRRLGFVLTSVCGATLLTVTSSHRATGD